MPTEPRTAPAQTERKTVDQYIAKLDEPMASVVSALCALVREAAPEAAAVIKWGQPVFEQNGPFAYIKAHRNYANLGFWRGAELDDPKGLLEGSGDRMRHVKVAGPGDIRKTAFRNLVRDAVRLNREQGDPSKRSTK